MAAPAAGAGDAVRLAWQPGVPAARHLAVRSLGWYYDADPVTGSPPAGQSGGISCLERAVGDYPEALGLAEEAVGLYRVLAATTLASRLTWRPAAAGSGGGWLPRRPGPATERFRTLPYGYGRIIS